MSRVKRVLASVVCASLIAPALPPAQAAAAPLLKPEVAASDGVTLAQHRGRGGRHHHRGRGGAGAAGIIGAIIAGTLIAAAIREGRAHEDDIERCEEEFDSFDPRTGTYINRYGDERVCPYLR